jgi:recombination protein RecT
VIEGNYAPIIDDETGEIADAKPVTSRDARQSRPGSDPVGVADATGKKVKADGVSAVASDPSDQEPSARLKAIYEQMAKATSTDVLDEIYVRAEGDLDGSELEALMREYRTCKAAIGRLI